MAESMGQIGTHSGRLSTRRPFSARNALRLSAILTGVHGLVLIVSPGFGLSSFDAPQAGDAGYWVRHSAILFLGLTIVFWAAASFPSSMMQRPVLLAAAVVMVMLTIFGAMALLGEALAPTFGLVVGAELVLTVWLAWLLATDGI